MSTSPQPVASRAPAPANSITHSGLTASAAPRGGVSVGAGTDGETGGASAGSVPEFSRGQLLYVWLAGLFVTCLLVANIVGSKFFLFGTANVLGIELDISHSVGMFAFPVTFLLTDLLNEYYGPRGARRVTFVGLACSLLAFGLLHLAMAAPEAPPGKSFIDEAAFDVVIGSSQGMIIASMVAYLIGQFTDIVTFRAFKRLTGGRLLWLRATGSTVISQAVDSLAIMTVLYLSSMLADGSAPSLEFVLVAAAKGYAIKFMIAVAMTPLVYAGRGVVQGLFGLKPAPMRG